MADSIEALSSGSRQRARACARTRGHDARVCARAIALQRPRPGRAAPGRDDFERPLLKHHFGHVSGFGAPFAVPDLELHGLPFVERAKAVALDRGVVNEDVLLALRGNESIALLVVE